MRQRIFYGWVMAAVAFVVILIGAGTRAAPGALLLPIQGDTGWTTGQITIAGAAGLLLLGLGGPVSGWLIDRFGVRNLTVGALLLTGAGMGLSALDQSGDYTLAYLTAGWMAVAAGVVILGLRRVRRAPGGLAAA